MFVISAPQTSLAAPELMPVLSRGHHRNARRGACFMEYASWIAGEKWSDHPSCTHPAVAGLARLVNDWIDDDERYRLVPLISSVVGLNGDDPRVPLEVALRAAAAAIPVANECRQRVLAVAIIRCSILLEEAEGRARPDVTALARDALDQAPLAERWALDNLAGIRPRPLKSFIPMCTAISSIAIAGIGEACVPDTAARLERVLRESIDSVTRMLRSPSESPARALIPA